MRYRKLQRKFDASEWVDEAYAYENRQGQVIFRYNLTWGRMGSHLNQQIKDTGLSLAMLETILPSNQEIRWLPIQIVADEQAEACCVMLDQACAIPNAQAVAAIPAD